MYALSTVDKSGRVADRRTIRALGWLPATCIEFREDAGNLVATRSLHENGRVDARGFLNLPLLVRRWCGVETGDRLLLAADPVDGVLTAYPVAVLDRLLGSRPTDGGEPA